jgi:hypothetical protein
MDLMTAWARAQWKTLGLASLLALVGCGDDGVAEGTEGNDDTTSSTTVTTTNTTTSSGDTTSTTSAADTATTSGADTGTGTDTGTGSDTGTATDTDTDTDTGGADACADLDMATCETTDGCLWVGNMQNGECVNSDPLQCDGLEMMACNLNPICEWDNMAGTCGPIV